MTSALAQTTAGALPRPLMPRPARRRLFLCPPAFYDVTYSINPWMDPAVPVDFSRAWRGLGPRWSRSWTGSARTWCSSSPRRAARTWSSWGTPGSWWATASCAAASGTRSGSQEAEHYRRSFRAAGYEVVDLPPGAILEGLGDVAVCGTKAILGHGPGERGGAPGVRSSCCSWSGRRGGAARPPLLPPGHGGGVPGRGHGMPPAGQRAGLERAVCGPSP